MPKDYEEDNFDYSAEDDLDDDDDFDYAAEDCDDDWCYECTGYGDDYFVNEEGDLECACPTCPHNRINFDDRWDD